MNDDAATRRTLAARLLGHHFHRPALLDEALTHRSALHGRKRRRGTQPASNERLEFVGDRVLGLLIAEWLLERFPGEAEGPLAMRLARLASRPVLAQIAETIGLSEALALSPADAASGVGRLATVRADAMEAVIGALYLDGGLHIARHFVRTAWADTLTTQTQPPKDPKTALQEHLASLGQTPTYRVTGTVGPSHAPRFTVTVDSATLQGTGTASSKRDAERTAAADLLARLEAERATP